MHFYGEDFNSDIVIKLLILNLILFFMLFYVGSPIYFSVKNICKNFPFIYTDYVDWLN